MTNVALTADGSKTIFCRRFGEHYHSKFGAVSESNHVFIEAGYLASKADSLAVLEIGFGTGLNAWLSLQQARRLCRDTFYEAVELYPVDDNAVCELSDDDTFRKLHAAAWEQPVEIVQGFVLHKRKSDMLQTVFTRKFDLVYYDAFSPAVQPEMWTRSIFERLHAGMRSGAILTTYCAKGEVRRTMQSVGFYVERLPGHAGKREMLRAKKM